MKTTDINAACRALSLAFGFPLLTGTRFYLDGVRYCVTAADVEALAILARIRAAWPSTPNVHWLLPFRAVVRQCRAGTMFAYAAQQTQDPALRCLAVWLRGRRGGRLGSSTIAGLYRRGDVSLRKAVVRALQRMHAWAALRRIEACEPELRIRRLARQKTPRAYRSRMTQFITNVTPRQPGGLPAFFEQQGLELDVGLQPRPATFFRAILERIRRLVRGTAASTKSGSPQKRC
jgi:hypothetical protein